MRTAREETQLERTPYSWPVDRYFPRPLQELQALLEDLYLRSVGGLESLMSMAPGKLSSDEPSQPYDPDDPLNPSVCRHRLGLAEVDIVRMNRDLRRFLTEQDPIVRRSADWDRRHPSRRCQGCGSWCRRRARFCDRCGRSVIPESA